MASLKSYSLRVAALAASACAASVTVFGVSVATQPAKESGSITSAAGEAASAFAGTAVFLGAVCACEDNTPPSSAREQATLSIERINTLRYSGSTPRPPLVGRWGGWNGSREPVRSPRAADQRAIDFSFLERSNVRSIVCILH